MTALPEPFSSKVLMVNGKWQTSGCPIDMILLLHLQFRVHVWMAVRASGSKHFIAQFFAKKIVETSLVT